MTVQPLRRVFMIVNGGTPTSDPENWDGEVAWATPIDLGRVNGSRISETQRTLSDEGLRTGSSLVPAGSLIVSTRAPIGYVAQTTVPMAFNQGCRGLAPRVELDIRFFRYQLLVSAERLQSRGQGSTFVELSTDALASLPVAVPPLAEQRAVADYLDTETTRLDAMLAAERQRAARAVDRVTALTEALVLGRHIRADVVNQPVGPLMPPPDGWTVRRNKTFLREVVDLSATGEEELLTVSHLTGIAPRSEKDVTMFLAESNEGYKRVRPGDLVINTMWAWMGALGVSAHEGIVSPAYGVYRFTDPDMEPLYFDALFRSRAYVAEMTRYSRGVWTSRLRLYPESFLGIRSPVPHQAEQRGIADAVTELSAERDRLVRVLVRSVELLLERRQAVITAAVTGQLDIPGVTA